MNHPFSPIPVALAALATSLRQAWQRGLRPLARWIRPGRWAALAIGLLALAGLAQAGGDADQSVVLSIDSMRGELQRAASLRGRPVDTLSPDDVALLRISCRRLGMQLAFMRSALARMGSDSAAKAQLEAFVTQWQDDERLEAALRAAPGRGNALEADLDRLGRHYRAGFQWRTPFPLFRP